MSGVSTMLTRSPLFLRLMFPQTWMRLWVLIGIGLLLTGSLLDVFIGWDKAKVFILFGALPVTLLSLISLPVQIICLGSCRPLSLLGNGRLLLFCFLLVVCLSTSLVAHWTLVNLSREQIPFSFFLLVCVMVSIPFTSSVWFSSRWMFGREFLNLIYGGVCFKFAPWFFQLNPLYWALMLVACWGVYAFWWFRWQPEGYKADLFFLSPSDPQKVELQQRMQLRLTSGRADSWLGSRLLGAPDGWLRRAKEMLLLPVFLAAVLIPLSLLFSQFAGQIKSGVSILLLLLTSGMGFTVTFNLYRFLPMVWLTGMGRREQLFSQLWKRFWVEVATGIFTIFALLLLWELVLGKWSGAGYWLLLFGVVLLFQTLIFFLASWMYLKGSFQSFSRVTMLSSAWFICLCATGLLFPLPFGWTGISIHWLWIPELVVLALLYRPVRSGFAKINFVRLA